MLLITFFLTPGLQTIFLMPPPKYLFQQLSEYYNSVTTSQLMAWTNDYYTCLCIPQWQVWLGAALITILFFFQLRSRYHVQSFLSECSSTFLNRNHTQSRGGWWTSRMQDFLLQRLGFNPESCLRLALGSKSILVNVRKVKC